MSFNDEWAQIKSEAIQKGPDASTAMQLNGDGGDGKIDPASPFYMPKPGEGMSSDPAAKRKAAKYIEEELAPDTKTAGVHAGNATETVTGSAPGGRLTSPLFMKPQVDTFTPGYVSGAGEFDGWDVKAGLNKAMTRWSSQLANLMGRLSGEVGALRQAGILYQNNDGLTGNGLTPGPQLSDPGTPLLTNPSSPLLPTPPRSRLGDL